MSDLRTLLASSAFPVPDGRMWRVATSWRGPPAQAGYIVGELTDVLSRKVHLDLYGPSTAECTAAGKSMQTVGIVELAQDLLMYRFNAVSGLYSCVFRGPIGRLDDAITDTTHTLTISAGDYRALIARLFYGAAQTFTQTDQATIVAHFVNANAVGVAPPRGLGLQFGGVLNPDGSSLGQTTGVLRDRTYTGAELTGTVIDDLSQVINGFDWAALPYDPAVFTPPNALEANVVVYYPQRGVAKPAFIAEYGVTVSNVTRSVDSTSFANYVRIDGTNSGGVPLFATSSGDVMTNPQNHPEGLWPLQASAADVSVTTTLQQQSDGQLALSSQLSPAYTLDLVPGTWNTPADCWLGDTIELRVKSGRLNVDTFVRIVAMDFDIDDSGQERLSLTVGRPPASFVSLFQQRSSTIEALTRR